MSDRVPVASPEVLNAPPDAPRIESNDAPLPQDVMGDFIKGRMAELMGTTLEDSDMELSNILEWVRNKGADTPEKAFGEVRDLMYRLGTSGLFEGKASQINRYVYFDNQRAQATEEMEAIEDGN